MAESYLKEIQLPSKGVLYQDKIPNGLIHIEPMGMREEKLFAGSHAGSAIINRIYDTCVKLPNNFDHRDLILGDRTFILFQLRSITYGSAYTYHFKCSECNKRSTGVLDLDKLPVNSPQDSWSGTIPVSFPVQGKTAELRFLTGNDEDKIDQYSRQMERHGADKGAEHVYRLARRIEKLDGVSLGIKEAIEFVEGLKGADSLAISDALTQYDIGPNLDVYPDCTQCRYPNGPMMLPLDQEFFSS